MNMFHSSYFVYVKGYYSMIVCIHIVNTIVCSRYLKVTQYLLICSLLTNFKQSVCALPRVILVQ